MKLLIVALFLSLSTLVEAQDNLIANPSCDLPLVNGKIPSWVEVVGNEWTKRADNPEPYKGEGYFFAGNTPDAELAQTIFLDDYICSIDQGNQGFVFVGYVNSFAETLPDQPSIIIDVLDVNDAVINSYTIGPSSLNYWNQFTKAFFVPVKSRKIKIRLLSHRRSGTSNDGYFDELALVAAPGGKNFTIASIATIPASCGRSDGVLSVSIASGPHLAARQYSIDGGQTFQVGSTFLNLVSKAYNITVKDGGCVQSQTVTVGIKNPPKIDRIQTFSASCGLSDGAISLTVLGGGSPTTYALNGKDYQANPSFQNLAGGRYTVTVKESDCVVTSDSIVVGQKRPPRIDDQKVTDASCNQPDGTISLTVSGANGPLQYSLNNQSIQFTPVFLNLATGDYKVTVKDGACAVDKSIKVGLKSLVFNSIQIRDASCNGRSGSITTIVTGGNGVKAYSLNGQPSQSSPTFQNLDKGNYIITVTDGGCTASQTATVGNALPPRIDNTLVTESGCGLSNGTLSLTALGGSGNLQYSIDGQTFQSGTTFENLAVGSYTITIKDEADCSIKQMVDISPSDDCYVYVPEAFSPNHDGVNDYFQPISGYKINYNIRRLTIYNRWGEVLFSRENFSILESAGWWDGTFQGGDVEAGAYSYHFEYVNLKNKTISRRGIIILLR